MEREEASAETEDLLTATIELLCSTELLDSVVSDIAIEEAGEVRDEDGSLRELSVDVGTLEIDVGGSAPPASDVVVVMSWLEGDISYPASELKSKGCQALKTYVKTM